MRPKPELELAGARGARAGATASAVVPEKEELCLHRGDWVARSSIPIRWASNMALYRLG